MHAYTSRRIFSPSIEILQIDIRILRTPRKPPPPILLWGILRNRCFVETECRFTPHDFGLGFSDDRRIEEQQVVQKQFIDEHSFRSIIIFPFNIHK